MDTELNNRFNYAHIVANFSNGNMTCRVENGQTFKQSYNSENRIYDISKMNGNCETGTILESWLFGYDGDGVRVSTAHFTGGTADSLSLYFFGGAYEVSSGQVSGNTTPSPVKPSP